MKYLVFLLIFLSSCSRVEKEYLYINTIAISYSDEFEVTILKYDESDSIIANEKGNSILECFNKIDQSIGIRIGLNYLSNLIIQKNSLEYVTPKLLEYVSKNREISLNFYVYTCENIEEIMNVKGVKYKNNTTFHNNPRKCDNIIQQRFLEYALNYKDNSIIKVPLLEISNTFNESSLYSNKIVEINI